MGEPWHDADTLRRLYHDEQLSQNAIAERLGCDTVTIHEWMERHGIEKRSRSEAQSLRFESDDPWKDPDVLHELYVECRMTQPEIADELGCGDSTVSNWIRRLDIKRPWEDESTLRELYEDRGMSQSQIADELDCSVSTVEKHMTKHGIQGRPHGRAESVAKLGPKTHETLSDPDLLRDMYVNQSMTCAEIGEEVDAHTNTVVRWVNKHGFMRSQPEYASLSQLPAETRDTLRDGQEMRRLYADEENSLPAIATELDCTVGTVANWLEEHGIETRSIADALGTGSDHPMWKGGPQVYGPNWHEQRDKRLERDDYECVVCSAGVPELGQNPDVHHIIPLREFVVDGELDHEAANDLTNLVSLCRSCHGRWEGIPLRPQSKS